LVFLQRGSFASSTLHLSARIGTWIGSDKPHWQAAEKADNTLNKSYMLLELPLLDVDKQYTKPRCDVTRLVTWLLQQLLLLLRACQQV
jgi:hypothetical protein